MSGGPSAVEGDAGAPATVLAECRHGRLEVLSNDSCVGRSLVAYGEWTEGECALLAGLLRPGDCVVDVGAHVGAHALAFAKAVGPAGRVIAFEPQPFLCDLLAANMARNGAAQVEARNAGCGERPGAATLASPDYRRPGNFGAVRVTPAPSPPVPSPDELRRQGPWQSVRMETLDEACAGITPALVKIDVEGAELDVLRGARSLIRRCRPVLYVENEDPATSEALLRHLAAEGYHLSWHIVRLFSPDNFNREPRNIFGQACCVNVLCLPPGREPADSALRAVADLASHPRRVIAQRAAILNARAEALREKRMSGPDRAGFDMVERLR